MTNRKLGRFTTTPDETGRMVTYPAGTELPAEVAEQVTNEKAWEADGDEPEAPKPEPKKSAAKRPYSK